MVAPRDAVAARAAGVDEVVVCSPPGPSGEPPAEVLAAAAIGGATRVFALGGSGAVAAMAFGTATVPRCDVVVGPGNRWVVEAKRQVAGNVRIDAPAVVRRRGSEPAHFSGWLGTKQRWPGWDGRRPIDADHAARKFRIVLDDDTNVDLQYVAEEIEDDFPGVDGPPVGKHFARHRMPRAESRPRHKHRWWPAWLCWWSDR